MLLTHMRPRATLKTAMIATKYQVELLHPRQTELRRLRAAFYLP